MFSGNTFYMKYVFLSSIALAGAGNSDVCTTLCMLDGPSICTEGSWTIPGSICRGYMLPNYPSTDGYCYSTSASGSNCPSSGRPMTLSHAESIVAARRTGSTTTTTTRAPRAGDSPTLYILRRCRTMASTSAVARFLLAVAIRGFLDTMKQLAPTEWTDLNIAAIPDELAIFDLAEHMYVSARPTTQLVMDVEILQVMNSLETALS